MMMINMMVEMRMVGARADDGDDDDDDVGAA